MDSELVIQCIVIIICILPVPFIMYSGTKRAIRKSRSEADTPEVKLPKYAKQNFAIELSFGGLCILAASAIACSLVIYPEIASNHGDIYLFCLGLTAYGAVIILNGRKGFTNCKILIDPAERALKDRISKRMKAKFTRKWKTAGWAVELSSNEEGSGKWKVSVLDPAIDGHGLPFRFYKGFSNENTREVDVYFHPKTRLPFAVVYEGETFLVLSKSRREYSPAAVFSK